MAGEVTVDIGETDVIIALNSPGGVVYEWRDRVIDAIMGVAFATSPVNNPENAKHRGYVVGTYKASWTNNRIGSNGHSTRGQVENSADHAIFVEIGRDRVHAWQEFSWTRWEGEIHAVRNTRGYDGLHVLRDATNEVMPHFVGSYVPLP